MNDVNPNIYGNSLSLNISTSDNSANFVFLSDTAEYYDIPSNEASDMMKGIVKIVGENWRVIAKIYG